MPATIYDAYPLSLRALLEKGPPPPMVRALSQHHQATPRADDHDPTFEDDDASVSTEHTQDTRQRRRQRKTSTSLHDAFRLEMSSSSYPAPTPTPRQRTSLCSRYGKFHGEVFETKERNKVLSVLKRRGKTDAGAAPKHAPSKFTADDVLRAGLLTKEGSWRRNWKTRFFILRKDFPSLSYFKSEEKLELLGEIPITADTLVLDKSPSGHAPYRFQIRTADRLLLLEAESRDNQQRWIDATQELIDAVRADKFRLSTMSFAEQQKRNTRLSTKGQSVMTSPRRTSNQHDHHAMRVSAPIEIPRRSSGAQRLGRAPFNTSPDGDYETENRGDDDQSDDDTAAELHRLIEEEDWDEDNDDDDSDEEDNQLEHMLASTPARSFAAMPRQLASSRRQSSKSLTMAKAYDLSFEVVLGRMSKLMRSDSANDKAACFVKVCGFSTRSKTFSDIGCTDAVKIAAAIAASSSGTVGPGPIRIAFSLVLSCDLESFDQLRLTLYKCSLSQSPGTSQACIGIGRCLVDADFLQSQSRIVTLTEKSSSFHDAALVAVEASGPHLPAPSLEDAKGMIIGGGSTNNLHGTPSNHIQLVVQAFRSLQSQEVLPTSGIDMAIAKYLVPTTLGTSNLPTTPRHADTPLFLDNESFLGAGSDVGNSVRLVAVDEILRVPRSTFAFSLAYLDYLEQESLERTRVLHKQMAAAAENGESNPFDDVEMEFYRKKQEEYLKQRQFLLKQEKRLLDEDLEQKLFATVADLKKAIKKDKSDDELLAPFKRSTYKSLEEWQYLPTNMHDQFLCVYQRQSAGSSVHQPFVWHTMTMGCPAAHTKGFANGGFRSSDLGASNGNQPVYSSDDTDPSDRGTSTTATSASPGRSPPDMQRTRRHSRVSRASPADDSLASLKTRLELKDRMDVIGAQILSATVACIVATVDLASAGSDHHRLQLENALKFGYLINFESLLSTQGKEVGMLEDFAAGARWLRNVCVQFRKHKTAGSYFMIKSYTPPQRQVSAGAGSYSSSVDSSSMGSMMSSNLLVTIGITEQQMGLLPPLLATGKPFRVRCVLFSQGINEKQSLVHALKSNAVKLQERINRDNLEELKEIYAIFRRVHAHDKDSVSRDQIARHRAGSVGALDGPSSPPCISSYSIEALDDLLAQIEHHICSSTNHFKKNVALLMDTSDFCRELGAARVTCCKSGKDRTAMSVTLEQARLCCTELQATHGKSLCANMRLYGVRRKNVFMNTKADKFAFNEMQRKILPDCYKPPIGTYKSGKT
ncbi:TPA: hypothetical protein N0F65_000502 [Lagenidium giganteum]|uniref:PH domain-containing protein n=1 Tax=Lagenidium giganteum TaxID=4803 RepID=A0AAV2YXT9_9STRA|nr:TPA: hypothetical protein N0F65_000502 [Lagenidium giganteum]